MHLKHLQLLIVVGTVFMMSFMVADLPLIPDSLHHVYYISRLGMQLPILLVFFALTFMPFYARIHHLVLCLSVLGITYANYWVTIQSWLLVGFSFPYEGVLLYALFATFIMRLSFKYSLIYIACSGFGFITMTSIWPMYGELTNVKVAFVAFGLGVILLGVNRIEKTFQKLQIANDKLRALSQIDQLTQIYNRGTFDEKFNDMLNFAKRTKSSVCVFMIDLDYFKDYNDGYGHLKGDAVIKQQAQILKDVFSEDFDLVARYGGEEFVVACVGNTPQRSELLAQEIVQQWHQLNVPHGKGRGQAAVSCSIGFVCSDVHAQTTKVDLLGCADNALYEAKSTGRGKFVKAL